MVQMAFHRWFKRFSPDHYESSVQVVAGLVFKLQLDTSGGIFDATVYSACCC